MSYVFKAGGRMEYVQMLDMVRNWITGSCNGYLMIRQDEIQLTPSYLSCLNKDSCKTGANMQQDVIMSNSWNVETVQLAWSIL